jgi:hypothetical protein
MAWLELERVTRTGLGNGRGKLGDDIALGTRPSPFFLIHLDSCDTVTTTASYIIMKAYYYDNLPVSRQKIPSLSEAVFQLKTHH